MRWEVRGADATTGQDRVMSFEANTAEEARAMGNYNGLLVETVNLAQPKKAGPIEYRRPTGAAVGGPLLIDHGVSGAARTLRFTGSVIAGLGWLYLLGALAVGLAAITDLGHRRVALDSETAAIVFLGLVLTAVLLFAAAAALRMLAAIGLTVRDLAIIRTTHAGPS